MNSICVFCGSHAGNDQAYAAAAREISGLIAARGGTLVYGGGSVGLMGVAADEAMARGARVIGVIPRTLWEREVGHRGITENRVVETMHERKALMYDLADGFVALPGAVGTLDEFFETWTWAQLGVHAKPFGILNVAGYFDALLTFLNHVVESGFMRRDYLEMVLVDADARQLLKRMDEFVPPQIPKWATRQSV
ncbi:MAG: TIGR00730 family Rossman fold protein [Phycisphaerales bacterium]|nr:TIGR00730 family Rossman fold protein [Phycisphaerales bacterium]